MIPVLASAWHGLPLPGLGVPGLAVPGLALPGTASSGLLVLAAIALTGLLVALLAHSARVAAAVTAIPQDRRARALREKSWRAGFLPQRDPDAAGRARPRAPTAALAAACSSA